MGLLAESLGFMGPEKVLGTLLVSRVWKTEDCEHLYLGPGGGVGAVAWGQRKTEIEKKGLRPRERTHTCESEREAGQQKKSKSLRKTEKSLRKPRGIKVD